MYFQKLFLLALAVLTAVNADVSHLTGRNPYNYPRPVESESAQASAQVANVQQADTQQAAQVPNFDNFRDIEVASQQLVYIPPGQQTPNSILQLPSFPQEIELNAQPPALLLSQLGHELSQLSHGMDKLRKKCYVSRNLNQK